MSAGQASACLHTMAMLQAYQAEVFRDLDEGGEAIEDPEAIQELHWAKDLSLRAAKVTTRVVGHSMTAMVATERHQLRGTNHIIDGPLGTHPLGEGNIALRHTVPKPPRVSRERSYYPCHLGCIRE